LFIKHPYDVGDRVLIADTHLIVEHISLLYTSFKRVDNNRVVQISNISNNDKWIENVTRSKAMKEQVSVVVHAETSFADIEVMRGELEAFVLSPDNKRDFHSEVEIQIMEVKDLKSIELLVGVQHKVRSSYRNHTA
jgi:small-conductance mechanosensitive channel